VHDERIQHYLPKPRFSNETEPMAAEAKWKLATTVCLQPNIQAVAQTPAMAGHRRSRKIADAANHFAVDSDHRPGRQCAIDLPGDFRTG
jgi:hypothetical protein